MRTLAIAGAFVRAGAVSAFGAGPYDSAYVNVTGDTMTGPLLVNQVGVGPAAQLVLTNAANTSNALRITTAGRGKGGSFAITNPLNSREALEAVTELSATSIHNASGQFTSDTGTLVLNHPTNVYGKLDVTGSAHVSGTFSAGVKQFVQPHPSDPAKEVANIVIEGPESAVFLRGTARLVDGVATIETPEHFRMVAGDQGLTVQFTPRSARSKGLAAVTVSRGRIQVAELLEGSGSYEFDSFVTA